MAKKAAQKVAKKKSVPRPGAKKKIPAASRRTTASKSKPPRKKVVARKPRPKTETLGRPLVRAEEKLYMLFREDYHARQIFEFLRVETVGELEQFSASQIIQILSAPVRKTVERVRERLAEHKRSLRDDAEFAREHLRLQGVR